MSGYFAAFILAGNFFVAFAAFAARTPATDSSFALRLPTAAALGLPQARNDEPANWAGLPGAGLEAEFATADAARASR